MVSSSGVTGPSNTPAASPSRPSSLAPCAAGCYGRAERPTEPCAVGRNPDAAAAVGTLRPSQDRALRALPRRGRPARARGSSWSGSCRSHGSSRADISACGEPLDDLPGRLARPAEGDRPVRPGPRDRVLVLRRADDPRRAQAPLPRPAWSVRVPRDLQELALKVDGAGRDLGGSCAARPRSRRSPRRLSVDRSRCSRRCEAGGAYRATSLDTPARRRGGGDTLADSLGRGRDGFAQAEHARHARRLLCALGPREREVLRLRFEEDLTQAEIGERIGVSQMQVSRLSASRSPGCARAAADAE